MNVCDSISDLSSELSETTKVLRVGLQGIKEELSEILYTLKSENKKSRDAETLVKVLGKIKDLKEEVNNLPNYIVGESSYVEKLHEVIDIV